MDSIIEDASHRFRKRADVMTMKERIHHLVDRLPEAELGDVARLLENKANDVDARTETIEERAELVRSIRGKYAHVPTSVDEFIKRKQEDIALEEEQSRRRMGLDDR